MATLFTHQLRKVFGRGTVAVDRCDLAVRAGEFLVVVGPSGCGKSTLLRMIAGLEAPTSGTIEIAGRDVTRLSPRERDIAMVFQDFTLYPHMSGRRNLAFALKLRKIPRDEIARRIEHAADLLGIESLLNRKPGELSGGERQRIALGRVIVRRPACALYDEPLSNLDAQLRLRLRQELRAMHQREPLTSVYVTHDQEEAMTLADRLAVMAEGRLQQIGAPAEIYQQPANRFVAGFIGSPPMNFLEGRVERVSGSLAIVTDGGSTITLPHGVRGGTSPPFPGGAGGGSSVRDREEHHCDAIISPSDETAGANETIVLGIRPEVVRLRPLAGDEGNAALRAAHNEDDHDAKRHGTDGGMTTLTTGRTSRIETIGRSLCVHVELAGGRTIIALVDAHRAPEVGKPVRIEVDPAHLHLFEPGEYGRLLRAPGD